MNATTSTHGLEERIEKLVREHISTSQAAATAAVARAFAESSARTSKTGGRRRRTSTPRPARRRRTPEQVADLAERFFAAVHAAPGEAMTTLAAKVGATARELSVAVARLRRQGRVRTVGQRHHTKYFPAAPTESVS